jgi:hypothetical protein
VVVRLGLWYSGGGELGLFRGGMLGRVFVLKRVEVTGGWRKLHNEELHNLHPSPVIIRMIKSRRIRLVGHTARMGQIEMHWWERQKERTTRKTYT